MSFSDIVEEVPDKCGDTISIEDMIGIDDTVQDLNVSVEEVKYELNVIEKGLNTLTLMDNFVSNEELLGSTAPEAVKLALTTNNMVYKLLGYNDKVNKISLESIKTDPTMTYVVAKESMGSAINDSVKNILTWFTGLFKKVKTITHKVDLALKVKGPVYEKELAVFKSLSSKLKDPHTKIPSKDVYEFINKFATGVLLLSNDKKIIDYLKNAELVVTARDILRKFSSITVGKELEEKLIKENTSDNMKLNNNSFAKNYLSKLTNGDKLLKEQEQDKDLYYLVFLPYSFIGKSVSILMVTYKLVKTPMGHEYPVISYKTHKDTIKSEQLPSTSDDFKDKDLPHFAILESFATIFNISTQHYDSFSSITEKILKHAKDSIKDTNIEIDKTIADSADKEKEEKFIFNIKTKAATSKVTALAALTASISSEHIAILDSMAWIFKVIAPHFKSKE